MSKVNQRILTEQEFNTSPFKSFMSYNDYFKQALKYGSTFTFAHALSFQNAQDTSEKIKKGVKGWYIEKEKEKGLTEQKYYEALAEYSAMKTGNEIALKNLEYATNMYGEDSTQYSDALKKYKLAGKSLFSSDTNLTIARDNFNSANISAFKAFLSTRG